MAARSERSSSPGKASDKSSGRSSAAKPAVKSTAKPAAKSTAKPAAKSTAKPAVKSAAKSTVKSTAKSAKPLATARSAQRAPARRDGYRIHLISDFTGNLANHVVSTVLSQFGAVEVQRVVHRFCNSDAEIDRALSKVEHGEREILVHAVIDAAAKGRIEDWAATRAIPCYDLTGPVSRFLSEALQETAADDLVHLHKTDEEYFHRIDAMEFTLQHDDSRRLESIHEADVVLLGISRVSKSPTSTFLGSLGYKAANVSIAPEIGLPKELKRCKGRVVALTMQSAKLFEIRQRRFRLNGFATALAERDESLNYLQLRDVAREVMEAEQLYRKAKFPIVDVTAMTIEEVATHVLEELGLLDPK